MILTLIFAVISTEAITEILLHSELLDKPRGFLLKLPFFGSLFSCGWCLSFWVALLVFGIIMLRIEIILVPIVFHRLSNYLHYLDSILKMKRWRK